MTKYLVTMNSAGYGRFGVPRQELRCEEVNLSELYVLLADLPAIVANALLENPVKKLKIEVVRI